MKFKKTLMSMVVVAMIAIPVSSALADTPISSSTPPGNSTVVPVRPTPAPPLASAPIKTIPTIIINGSDGFLHVSIKPTLATVPFGRSRIPGAGLSSYFFSQPAPAPAPVINLNDLKQITTQIP